GVGGGAPNGLDGDGTQRGRRPATDRAVRVAGDGDLVASGEAMAHRALSSLIEREGGDGYSRTDVLERHADNGADRRRRAAATEQASDEAKLGLLVQLDVHQRERDIGIEPRQQ